jgi:ERCC4-related helicase
LHLAVFNVEPESARDHYQRTVLKGVPLPEAIKFDPEAEVASEDKKLVRVWGVEPSQLNLSRWERLQPNDIVAFFNGKLLTSIGRISRTIRSSDLARNFWGEDKAGGTWELACYVVSLTEIRLPISSLNTALGYAADYKPQGFTISEESRVESFLAKSKETDLWSALLHMAPPGLGGLKSLELKLEYRSGEDDLVNDFYIPCLEQSVSYERAAGYFSAQTLNLAARGVAGLVRNDGTMRLVVNPELSKDDVERIKQGYEQRLDEILVEQIKASLVSADEAVIKRVEALAWLVASGKLEIKVALVTREDNQLLNYPYHEKWGIFLDWNGEKVVFTGSMNETPEGLKDNFEDIDVYCSWKGDDSKARIAVKERDFERLWEDKTHGLKVLDFPQAAKKELLKYRPSKAPGQDPGYREPRCPACLELVDRTVIKQGVPVCLSCNAFLPLPLVGFQHYIIEGCRVHFRIEDRGLAGRVLKADYPKHSFNVRTDTGQRVEVAKEIQRIAFSNGQKVLANGKPAVVMSYRVTEKDGRLTYTVLLEGEERVIPEQGVEPAPPSVEEQIRSQTFENPEKWRLYVLASLIESAPYMKNGEALLTASSKVKPYQHQLTIAGRIVNTLQPRFLLADEVGLGKTIEVGLALKELQMRGLIERVLIVSPKLLVNQWIGELERRFNISCKEITSADFSDASRRGTNPFDEVEFAIASYQLVQREQKRTVLLESREWDVVVVDEAHHIRRDPLRGEKNKFFELVDGWENEEKRQEGLREKCEGLLLVTATPLQLRIQELYDLMSILGLGGKWSVQRFFERFFEQVVLRDLGVLSYRIEMARDFLEWGSYDRQSLQTEIAKTGNYAIAIEEMLFAGRRPSLEEQSDPKFLERLHKILDLCTPLKWSMFRNTREVLRKYGLRIPTRIPKDHLFPLGKPDEEEIYNDLSDYIRHFYEKSMRQSRTALGFVMATYRKRLTSSFYAIKRSLEKRLDYLTQVRAGKAGTLLAELTLPEEQEEDDPYTEEDRQSAYLEDKDFVRDIDEEIEYVRRLLASLNSLNSDTKLARLRDLLEVLFRKGIDKVIIFTQYYDTLDYLRKSLSDIYEGKVVCYSGKGGETWDGSHWKTVATDDAVKAFQQYASVMISTEAGSEGKNFQFCNVIVNYDLPWNPMRVEQRIGRIDRIGQRRDVEIHNMFFENTIDGEVYTRLRKRIRLFETVVGPLHPILERVEKYALEYPREEALVKIGKEMEEIETEHTKALEIEERAQEFLFSGFDKSILEPFDVKPPIRSEDIRAFVEFASRASQGEMRLQPSQIEGLYTLALNDNALTEVRRKGGQGIKAETPVIFNPDVAEELADADPTFQEARLIAHGSPILDFLLDHWKQDPQSRVTGLRSMNLTSPTVLLLYRARFAGLLRAEDIFPIQVDFKTLQAKETTLEWVVQEMTRDLQNSQTENHPLAASIVVDDVDLKFEGAIKNSRELWGRVFDSLNNEWSKKNEEEYERRKKLFEGSLGRVYSKARAVIDVQVRRLIALRYIQEHPNTDRLPDGEIDVTSIAGPIEHSPELSDVFQQIQFDPSEVKIRGQEVKDVARSFRTAKQRQALHLQIRNASQMVRTEHNQYRKTSDRINSRIAELDKQRGAQATYSLLSAAILSPG